MRIQIRKLSEDKVPGGKGDNLTLKDIALMHDVEVSFLEKQLAKGIQVELEHTYDGTIAAEIATDHLTEDPHYYEKLQEQTVLKESDWVVAFTNETGETELDLDNFLDLYGLLDKYRKLDIYDESSNFAAQLELLKPAKVELGEPIIKWSIASPERTNGSGKLHDFISKYIIFQKHKRVIHEDAPANNVGSGNIAGTNKDSVAGPAPLFTPHHWFANSGVFNVEPEAYYKMVKGKKRGARYSTVMDTNDPLYHTVRGFSYKYKDKGIILQNSASGAMCYLRHPRKQKDG